MYIYIYIYTYTFQSINDTIRIQLSSTNSKNAAISVTKVRPRIAKTRHTKHYKPNPRKSQPHSGVAHQCQWPAPTLGQLLTSQSRHHNGAAVGISLREQLSLLNTRLEKKVNNYAHGGRQALRSPTRL